VTTTAALTAPFVRSDAGTLRNVLLLGPTEAIATVPPVYGESHAIAGRALEQFTIMSGRLATLGVKVTTLDAGGAVSFGSSCSDGAVIFEDGAFMMRPSDVRRRAEVATLEDALGRAGVPVVGRIEAPGLLDGGDVLLTEDTVFIGYPKTRREEVGIPPGLHGNAFGREQLAAYARTTGRKVVDVAIAAEVSRLRSIASPIGAGTILLAPGLLDVAAFEKMTLIEAPRGEDYGAGVLVLGPRRVLANLRFRETIPLLRKAKVAVEAIDLWEFGKIGITPSALALGLKRT
jgi:dimethylargininase